MKLVTILKNVQRGERAFQVGVAIVSDDIAASFAPDEAVNVSDYELPTVSIGGKLMLHGMSASSIAAGATSYTCPGTVIYANEDDMRIPMPFACKVTGMTVRTSALAPDGDLVITLRKESVETSMTITVPRGSFNKTIANVSGSVVFARGDTLSLKVVNGSPTGAVKMRSYSLVVEPT